MTPVSLAGNSGVVSVEVQNPHGEKKNVDFSIAPLDLSEEKLLYDALKNCAEKYKKERNKRLFSEIAELSDGSVQHEKLKGEMTSMLMGSISSVVAKEEALSARQTLAGFQIELWHRCRKNKPELRIEDVQAVVNEENYFPAYVKLFEINNPKGREEQHKSHP